MDKSKKDFQQLLLTAASTGADLDVIRSLGQSTVQVNFQDKKGNTALHLATSYGFSTIVDYLLRKDADVDCRNNNGDTPIHTAIRSNQPEIVRLLSSHSSASINSVNEEGFTPLSLAFSIKLPRVDELIVALLASGANFNIKSNNQWPILLAVQAGYLKVVDFIVSRSPDSVALATNSAGNNALHEAVRARRPEIVSQLMYLDLQEVANNDHKTPIDLAVESGQSDVAETLKKAQKEYGTHRTRLLNTLTERLRSTSNTEERATVSGFLFYKPQKKSRFTIKNIFSSNQPSQQLLAEKGWSRAFFSVNGSGFHKSEGENTVAINSTNLVNAKVSLWKPDQYPNCFELEAKWKSNKLETLVFHAQTGKEMERWFEALKARSATGLNPISHSVPLTNQEAHNSNLPFSELVARKYLSGSTWLDLREKLSSVLEDNLHQHEWIQLEQEEFKKPSISSVARRPENDSKNRYQNILPRDDTRVVLQKINDDESSDYINASHIKVGEFTYIASQAPLPNTFADFWRMIKENNCQVIVMLTRCVESQRHKANNYLPQLNQAYAFGDMYVSTEEIRRYGNYIWERKLKLSMKSNPNQFQVVYHWHFTGWPDHGVPEISQLEPLIKLVNKQEQELKLDQSPQLVHCSAGIGRTGTWIAIRYISQALQLAFESQIVAQVNIPHLVYHLRSQRDAMLTHLAQYTFIYQYAISQIENFIELEKNSQGALIEFRKMVDDVQKPEKTILRPSGVIEPIDFETLSVDSIPLEDSFEFINLENNNNNNNNNSSNNNTNNTSTEKVSTSSPLDSSKLTKKTKKSKRTKDVVYYSSLPKLEDFLSPEEIEERNKKLKE